MFLFIDTTQEEIILALFEKERLVDQIIKKARYRQAEILLVLLDKLLKKRKIKIERIKGIMVVKGPGSFTGTRIGVSVANALSFALDIPILGIKKEDKTIEELFKKYKNRIKNKKPVLPFYGRPPHTTKRKSF